MCLTVGRQSRDHRPLSRDPSVSFYKKFPNCLKRRKTLSWQSADGRVTSDHCRVTVQRLFSIFFLIAWNIRKTLFDKIFPNRLKRPKNVVWQSANGRVTSRPLSRDRSATFFNIFPNRLKRPKNVVWQSADGRVTSTTVAWPFSDFFQNSPKSLGTSKKPLFDSRPTVAWPPTLSRDHVSDFFQKNCLIA